MDYFAALLAPAMLMAATAAADKPDLPILMFSVFDNPTYVALRIIHGVVRVHGLPQVLEIDVDGAVVGIEHKITPQPSS